MAVQTSCKALEGGNGGVFARFAVLHGTLNMCVWCRCDLPYNPDKQMMQCQNCLEWCVPFNVA